MGAVRRLVLGGPGCGKTTRLLRLVEEKLEGGLRSQDIAFIAFTRQAANEAKDRAKKKFGLSEDDIPYFRTLHSLCFKELGVHKNDVMQKEHFDEFSNIVGEELSGYTGLDMVATTAGDVMLTIDNYARTTLVPLVAAWHELGGDIDYHRAKRFCDAYRIYKEERGLLDFTDMLERFVRSALPVRVKLAIVDEAQDLSALQWNVVDRAFGSVPELWVGGDDDQSIYRWSGADGKRFMSLPYEKEILPISHRLPAEIFEFSQQIITQVKERYQKDISPGPHHGVVDWVQDPDELDYSVGSWLVLARTRYRLGEIAEAMRLQGVVYSINGRPSVDQDSVAAILAYEKLRKDWRVEGAEAVRALRAMGKRTLALDEGTTYTAKELGVDCAPIWHDALIRIPTDEREYLLACRRRGETLVDRPRVRIETIHGAKGAEAENVLLLTDMTMRVQKGYELDPDSEHRVFFVGATRASQRLFLGSPRTPYPYPVP